MLLTVGACGSGGESEPAVSSGGADPEWVGQVLEAEPGADQPTLIGVDGDRVVVAVVSEEGVISGFATDDQGRFRAGEPTATGLENLRLGGVTRFGDGWVALGSGGLLDDEELLFDVRAFRSTDGRTWSALDATGFDQPADVAGLVTVDDALVAVGTLRTADVPSQGGFRPVAWHSADGERWTAVPLPTDGGTEGTVQSVVTTGDEVLAVGSVDRQGVMWSSTDGGATWAIVERDGIPPMPTLSHIARQRDVIVASGTAAETDEGADGVQLLLRSTDGGRSWQEATDPPPPNRGEGFAFPLYTGGGRFFALGHSFVESWSEPELCYADIELCRQDSAVALYASDDGDRWTRVDRSGIGEGEAGEVDAVTGTDDGRIVALRQVEGGIGTWAWPADTALPAEAEPVDPTTDVDLLAEGEVPEPGRRYAVPLYIHCGMEWLFVGDEPWQRTDDEPDTETGAGAGVPDDWPVAQQTIFGFATLVGDEVVEYSIGDGEVIATYAPATEDPPGCE
ncbi:MAG TPA: sialidase family protein [Acidimicrobiales bacterium]|nr:sialidase family protein [Acidimicrobiales bacterium]